MTSPIFSKDLDLRGQFVQLRNGSTIKVPADGWRAVDPKYVAYSTPTGWVYQLTNPPTAKECLWDIVAVPGDPDSREAQVFDQGLDLRGQSVLLRNGSTRKVPTTAQRQVESTLVAYEWPSGSVFQLTKPHVLFSCYDVMEVLSALTYTFSVSQPQDIDLPRIAEDIGSAPYAKVSWGDQSLVIAGKAAADRGRQSATSCPKGTDHW